MSIIDRLNRDLMTWKPNPGDSLTGTIIELDERDSNFSEGTYPVVTIVTDDGDEVAFYAFHTVAKNELAKQRPKVGDVIGVKYLGRDDVKKYERYKIVLERATPQLAREPDWSAMEAQTAAELGDVPPYTDADEPSDELF